MSPRSRPLSTDRLLAMVFALLLGASLVSVVAPTPADAANPCQQSVTMSELDDDLTPSTQVRGVVACQKARARIQIEVSVIYRRDAKDAWQFITYGQRTVRKVCTSTVSCTQNVVGGHGYDKAGWSGTYCATMYVTYGNSTNPRKVQHCRFLKDD